MKNNNRRTFLQQLGLGSSLIAGGGLPSPAAVSPSDSLYPSLSSFQNQDGDYLIRLSVRCRRLLSEGIAGRIAVEGGEIRQAKSYFMAVERWQVQANQLTWNMAGNTAYPYTIVLWITPRQDNPTLLVNIEQAISVSLSELFSQKGLERTISGMEVSVGLLGTREIGSLDASFASQLPDTENFTFAVMADPQGGDAGDLSNGSITRMKIHNAFIENSVDLVALLDNPAFCLVLGDIVDHQGQTTNFDQMLAFFKKADVPWLFGVGNHETKYQLTFGPHYDLSGFDNYLTAQQKINGVTKLAYSFDLGQWHFVVWPDPLREAFWETHPHYFAWLEQDLEQNRDRPTFFLQHIPLHPIGIDPLISYVESVEVKRYLLGILAKHGNVKYVLSGHVHIPLIASFKTAVAYRGIKLINLPAAGYRPRGFGEEDVTGGPVQGVAVVHIEADQAHLAFHTVTDEVYDYPEEIREFSPETYPQWLQHKWELEATNRLVNGDFSEGWHGWHRRYVYEEGHSPSNISEIRPFRGKSALYLFSASRGYRAPGQDRLPQTINRLSQAVLLDPQQRPALSFSFQIDDDNSQPENRTGAFVWIEGFERDEKKLDQVYSIGKAFGNLRDNHRGVHPVPRSYFDLGQAASLNQVYLNIGQDFEKDRDQNFSSVIMDRIALTLGIWTANEYPSERMGVYFTDLRWQDTATEASSSVNGEPVVMTASEAIFRKGIDHIAGEHKYVDERYVPPHRS